jgi:hypothetical protein
MMPSEILFCVQRWIRDQADLRRLSLASNALWMNVEAFFVAESFDPMSFDEGQAHTAFWLLVRRATRDQFEAFQSVRRALRAKADSNPEFVRYVLLKTTLCWIKWIQGYFPRVVKDIVIASNQYPAAYFLDPLEVLAASLFPPDSPSWERLTVEDEDIVRPRCRPNAVYEMIFSSEAVFSYPFLAILKSWGLHATANSVARLRDCWDDLVWYEGCLDGKSKQDYFPSIWDFLGGSLEACGNIACLMVLSKFVKEKAGQSDWGRFWCGAKAIAWYQEQGRWDWASSWNCATSAIPFGNADVLGVCEDLPALLREDFSRLLFEHALSTNQISLCHRIRELFPDIKLDFEIRLYPGFRLDNRILRLCGVRPGIYTHSIAESWKSYRRFRVPAFEAVIQVNDVGLLQELWMDAEHQRDFWGKVRAWKKFLKTGEEAEYHDWNTYFLVALRKGSFEAFEWLSKDLKFGLGLKMDWSHAALHGRWDFIQQQCGKSDPSGKSRWQVSAKRQRDRRSGELHHDIYDVDFDPKDAHLVYYAASYGVEQLLWVEANVFHGVLPDDFIISLLIIGIIQNDVPKLELLRLEFEIELSKKEKARLITIGTKMRRHEAVAWLESLEADA